MAKEIHEQPEVVGHTLARYIDMAALKLKPFAWPADPKQLKRLTIIGCGTAYMAGLVAKYWIERCAGLPVEIDVASTKAFTCQLAAVAIGLGKARGAIDEAAEAALVGELLGNFAAVSSNPLDRLDEAPNSTYVSIVNRLLRHFTLKSIQGHRNTLLKGLAGDEQNSRGGEPRRLSSR